MFQIGSSLREARVRRGLDVSRVERDTYIRMRYLRALEEEDFDALPGPAYAKGFLRAYADYLGLNGQRFVDEYNSRFVPLEEPLPAPPIPFPRRRLSRNLWVAIPVVAVSVALLGWLLTRGGGRKETVLPSVERTTTAASPPVQTITRAILPAPAAARLGLVAARGPCWLSVRLGSESGRVLYEQTLEPGRKVRFVGKRLWVRIGAPWNLDATLNGRIVTLPTTLGNVIATAGGVRAQP